MSRNIEDRTAANQAWFDAREKRLIAEANAAWGVFHAVCVDNERSWGLGLSPEQAMRLSTTASARQSAAYYDAFSAEERARLASEDAKRERNREVVR